ncbi:MAG TPA: transcription-repair coupling factor [Chloroflexota bacterium]|nr:transcription-repair coupling factor [Chloroflexota bacterium]
MRLVPLLDRFHEAPALAGLLDQLRTGRAEAAVIEPARPAVSAFLCRQLQSTLILVTSHPHRAEHLAAELAPWLEIPTALFPAFESLPYERVAVDKETLARRQDIVNRIGREPLAVATSIRALLQTVSLQTGRRNIETLRVGDRFEVDTVLAGWADQGYEAAPLVEEVGTFARRGGIVDVFPVGATDPVRIELFGPEIDSLRTFDPVSQRSLEAVASVEIAPMAFLGRDAIRETVEGLDKLDTSSLSPEGGDRWLEAREALDSGALEDAQFFAPALNRGATLLDAVGESPVLVSLDDADEVRRAGQDLVEQAAEFQRDLVSAGELPPGMPPALASIDSLERHLQQLRVVEFQRGGSAEAVESRVFTRPPEFGGRVRDFLHSLDPSAAHPQHEGGPTKSRALVITSFQHGRLAELLAAEGLTVTVCDNIDQQPEPGQITLVKGSLGEGWIAQPLGLDLYTDHEIFGWSRPRVTPRRKRAPREAFLSDFNPGDFVVHVEHGIGELTGTATMADGGAEREYLIVQYAGADRLYVPTDQLDRLTRYVGIGDAKPQLSKLGGADWSRAKTRAKKAAEDMAEELIGLYAQRQSAGGHTFSPDSPWQQELEASFPFEETADQLQAIRDVKSDMEEGKVMDRLVVADVGYGKTEVAVRAAFKAVIEGMQAAVLVPTTVLAMQHFETFTERLEAFPVRVELLSRFRSPKEQRATLERLADGEVDIVIGTHRLLSKDVRFNNLGLLVVDEEQRFGVRHKERLKQLRASVDVLTLTATPIPRTLHMSLAGIRDVSIIQSPPEGRLPIKTYLQPYEDRLVREAIIRELEREGQVYFVHNRVAGIEAVGQKLRRLAPEARVLVGHGQMPEDRLEQVMLDFSHHRADVLLCSTIIESGLDIPNVNTIVIDHAEALGLAQLYQLRGRVGRGVNQAYAYLLYPRDARLSRESVKRMEAVFEATELGAGFKIAMTDLEIRGAGNLLGAEQSGNVAAVGFDLYTNLLRDAIDRMRGQVREEKPVVTIDLPFDVLIPDAYVPDQRERLALYRKVARLESVDEIGPLREELRDRFGPLPKSVENLLTQIELKLMAQQARFVSIVLRGELLVIKGQRRIVFDRVGLYRRFGMSARIDDNTLRIQRDALSDGWLGDLHSILLDTIALRGRQAAALAGRA